MCLERARVVSLDDVGAGRSEGVKQVRVEVVYVDSLKFPLPLWRDSDGRWSLDSRRGRRSRGSLVVAPTDIDCSILGIDVWFIESSRALRRRSARCRKRGVQEDGDGNGIVCRHCEGLGAGERR